jgi:hypothetical protein
MKSKLRIKSICRILLFLSTVTLCFGEIVYVTDAVTVEEFVGSGFVGYVDGSGIETMFEPAYPFLPKNFQMTKGGNGNIYVIDGNYRIRSISQNGIVSTLIKNDSILSFSLLASNGLGRMISEASDSKGSNLFTVSEQANFSPIKVINQTSLKILRFDGICMDLQGNTFLSQGNRIYRLTASGILSVHAGSGNEGSADGRGIFCSFAFPKHLACDKNNNIFVWDSYNRKIRKIDNDLNVTTFSGSGGPFDDDGPNNTATYGLNGIYGMNCDDAGNLILACSSRIRIVDTSGSVKTIAGNLNPGYKNGTGKESFFNTATDVVCIGNTIYVAESKYPRIRKITIGQNSVKKPFDNIKIKLSAGITINGTVGKKYNIESSSNGGKQWNSLSELDLPKSPYTWYDESSVGTNNLYRVFETP